MLSQAPAEEIMTISAMLQPEFDQEMANTRKLLERVPEEKWDYKPHAKSMPLGRLAAHVAELPFWAKHTLSVESLDIKPGEKPFTVNSKQELLEAFDRNVAEAREALAKASDADMARIWTLSFAGRPVFSMPRSAVLRGSVLNHLIHHRAQLGVYLRLNDVAIPGMYGPSADEAKFWETGASDESEKKKLVRDRLAGLGYA
jgi:uncharacterized damage-inducible protein DinB